LAEETGAVVVLKGAATVTAEPEGRCVVNASGGPILATGGTGDVLTGVIGGLLAQGTNAFDAGALGAFLHGWAADRLAERLGSTGVLAGDLAAEIPAALSSLRDALGRTGGRPLLGGSDGIPFPEPL
jgi:NAD(P)H-hydrate epimerase